MMLLCSFLIFSLLLMLQTCFSYVSMRAQCRICLTNYLSITEIKHGQALEIEGKPMLVVEAMQVKPGRLAAFVRVKLKNLITGAVSDKTFKAGQNIEETTIDKQELEYMYDRSNDIAFLNLETMEEQYIPKNLFDNVQLLKSKIKIIASFWNGNPIFIKFPPSLEYTVIECLEEVSHDNTRKKHVILDTGLEVLVPSGIKEGNVIRISPDLKYLGKC